MSQAIDLFLRRILGHVPQIQLPSSDNNTISIVTPQNLITIGLNITVHKAIVSTGNFATHEYKITILGSEITAGTTRQVEDPIES
ncbi:MAG: hypothetical protein WCF07_08620, partial [Nitrososphaeraceae archaeon]